MSGPRGKRKELSGVVVSDRMDKTIVVRVGRTTRHAVYGRTIRKFKKYKAHDERNEGQTGDRVVIRESRPFSAEKKWRLVRIERKQ
jgi:small subunit ribosomal protein S17